MMSRPFQAKIEFSAESLLISYSYFIFFYYLVKVNLLDMNKNSMKYWNWSGCISWKIWCKYVYTIHVWVATEILIIELRNKSCVDVLTAAAQLDSLAYVRDATYWSIIILEYHNGLKVTSTIVHFSQLLFSWT